MTTIAIERELLVRIEKELFLARNYGGTLRDEPLLKKPKLGNMHERDSGLRVRI